MYFSPSNRIPYHPKPGKLSREEFERLITRANNLLDQATVLIMESRKIHEQVNSHLTR